MASILGKAYKFLDYCRRRHAGYCEVAAWNCVRTHYNERHKGYPKELVKFAEKHGFLPSTVIALGINEKNYSDYLCDDDYWRLNPLDGEFHNWIDNKLTLKYLLGDLSGYLPEYYFLFNQEGRLIKLMDCPQNIENSIDGIINLLCIKKKFAIKANRGMGGNGFYKVEVSEDEFVINDRTVSKSEIYKFFSGLSDYLVSEYLESAGIPAEIYPKTANSIRCIVGIEDEKRYNLGNFIKFGNEGSGYVDNLTGGGISCPVDSNGHFTHGYWKVKGVLTELKKHPDTSVMLEGTIEEWNQIQEMIDKIMKRLPELTYCGFDFVISDVGVRLLEINDMSGFLTIQKMHPLLKNKDDNFYLKRLGKLNNKRKK